MNGYKNYAKALANKPDLTETNYLKTNVAYYQFLIAIIDQEKKNYKRPILYNLGRVISYTIIGGIVGGIGSIFSFNDTVKGIIILIASIIMLLMALNMLGLIDFRLPYINRLKIKNKSHNALIIGLLNGLMPCGPLQAMQMYALSTGSIIKGALSMFLFSLCARNSIIAGSISPLLVPITRPSKGVSPIDVSTHFPRRTADTLAPLPK